MNYSKIFKILRSFYNLSQGDLSRILECDQSLISRIEKGQRNATNKMLEKLSIKLKIPMKLIYLIGAPESNLKQINSSERDLLVNEFLEMLRRYE